MEGIYFIQSKIDNSKNSGPLNKISDEIKSFENADLHAVLVNFQPIENGLRKVFLGKGILASLPFLPVFSYYKYNPEFDKKDFYYIRFEAADYPFRKFLKQLRKNNPSAKIVIEFPDFPNTIWMKSVLYAGIFLKDLYARRSYKKYINRFAVLNDDYKEIYGVKTVPYKNGIDVSRIPIKKHLPHKDDSLKLIAIGSMFPFHGFDRLLCGLKNYYEASHTKDVFLDIVGSDIGGERKKYEKYVEQNNLSEYVSFYERKEGKELADLFDKSDIAVSSLGMYRIGFKYASSLKSREYLARGIPIVAGCPIDVIHNSDFDYCIEFPNDDSSINIEKIVKWYDSLLALKSPDEITNGIRDFAMKNCDASVVMNNVIEYLKGDSN